MEPELDPQIQHVLEEIAAHPGARLFRLRSRKEGLFGDAPASATSSLWTRAERHLLAVHRSEVARLLFDAATLRLLSSRSTGRHLCLRLPNGTGREAPDRGDLEARSRRERGCMVDGTSDAMALVSRCFGKSDSPTAVELTMAALRIAPTDATRLLLGTALHFEDGDLAGKDYVLSGVLAGWPSPMVRSCTWQNLGLTRVLQGRWPEALECFASASLAVDRAALPAANWLWVSVRLDRSEDGLEAARLLASADDPLAIDAFLSWHGRTQAAPVDPSVPRSRVPRWVEDLPDPARSIAHAVA